MSDRELAARIDLEEDEGRPRVGSHAQFHALLRRQTNARLIVADPRDELATRYERLALCRNALLAEAHARLDDDGHLLTIDMDQEPLSPPTLVLATAAAMAPGGRLAPWAALTLSSTPWYRDTLALKTLGSLVPERAAAAGRQARRSVMHQAAGLGATSSLPLRQEGSPMGDPSGRPSLLCNCTVDPPRGVCLAQWAASSGDSRAAMRAAWHAASTPRTAASATASVPSSRPEPTRLHRWPSTRRTTVSASTPCATSEATAPQPTLPLIPQHPHVCLRGLDHGRHPVRARLLPSMPAPARPAHRHRAVAHQRVPALAVLAARPSGRVQSTPEPGRSATAWNSRRARPRPTSRGGLAWVHQTDEMKLT